MRVFRFKFYIFITSLALSLSTFSVFAQDGSAARGRRQGRALILPSNEVVNWIENHPLYKLRLQAPDSPEKELFLLLIERAKIHTKNSFHRDVYVLPGTNDDEGFFLMLAYAVETLQQNTPELVDSRVKGQFTSLIATAKGSVPSLKPRDELEIEIAQRFVLAGLALGIQDGASLNDWASKFLLDDLMVSQDLNRRDLSVKVRPGKEPPKVIEKRETKIPFQIYFNHLLMFNIHPIMNDRKISGIWRYWTAFDVTHFNSENEGKMPKAASELLFYQRVVSNDTDRREQQYEDFLHGSIIRLDLSRVLGKKWDALRPEEKEALTAASRFMLEAHPVNGQALSQLAKKSIPNIPHLTLGEWTKVFMEVLAASAAYTHEARNLIKRDLAVEQASNALIKSGSGSGEEFEKYFEDDFELLILNELLRAIAAGKLKPIALKFETNNSSDESAQQIFTYLSESIPQIIDQNDLLLQHVLALEAEASLQLNAALSNDQKTAIRAAYAEVVAQHIVNNSSDLFQGALEISGKTLENLTRLALAPRDSLGNPWSHSGAYYFAKDARSQIAKLNENTLEKLRKSLFEAQIVQTDIQLAAIISQAAYPANPGAVLVNIPEEFMPFGFDAKGKAWDHPKGVPSGQHSNFRKRLYRIALVFAAARPKNGAELSNLLRDPGKMNTYTRSEDLLFLTDAIAQDVYDSFILEINALLNREACARALAQSRQLAFTQAAN